LKSEGTAAAAGLVPENELNPARSALCHFCESPQRHRGTVRQLEPASQHNGGGLLTYQLLKDGRTYFDRHSKALAALQLPDSK